MSCAGKGTPCGRGEVPVPRHAGRTVKPGERARRGWLKHHGITHLSERSVAIANSIYLFAT